MERNLTDGNTIEWRAPSGEWVRLRALVTSNGEQVDVSAVVESGDSSADTIVDLSVADLRWPVAQPPHDVGS